MINSIFNCSPAAMWKRHGLCYMQRCRVDVADVSWPAGVENAEFFIDQDGSVQLSSVGESGSLKATVCLSPTHRTFTVRFLARIGQSSIADSPRSAAVPKGEALVEC